MYVKKVESVTDRGEARPMRKPKILVGEVKEFIEVITFCFHPRQSLPEVIKINYEEFFELRTFYSQLFQPEMITEYFKGFEFYNYYNSFYGYSDGIYQINFRGKELLFAEKIQPKTLSQFITNCIQAQIKLEWK